MMTSDYAMGWAGMGVAEAGAMNPFTFALKRAWWCMVRMLTKLIQMAWCTPARFELLLAIEQHPGISASDLGRVLGVSRQVIFRMVHALLAQELIVRRPGRDKRTLAIHLTLVGAGHTKGLRDTLATSGQLAHLVAGCLDEVQDKRSPEQHVATDRVAEVRDAAPPEQHVAEAGGAASPEQQVVAEAGGAASPEQQVVAEVGGAASPEQQVVAEVGGAASPEQRVAEVGGEHRVDEVRAEARPEQRVAITNDDERDRLVRAATKTLGRVRSTLGDECTFGVANPPLRAATLRPTSSGFWTELYEQIAEACREQLRRREPIKLGPRPPEPCLDD